MRLFFISWSQNLNLGEVIRQLQDRGHEIQYWSGTGLTKLIKKSDFPGVILHDMEDALLAIPPKELFQNDFLPAGEELLDQLRETESVVLTMMGKKFRDWSLTQRKNLYYQYIRYWHGALRKFKPELIIFSTIPHTNYDFVIYSLAKLLNIKTLMFEQSWVGDRVLAMSDFTRGSEVLEKEFQNNKSRLFSISDLSDDLRKHYKLQTGNSPEAEPSYSREYKRIYSGARLLGIKFKILLGSLKDFTIFNKIKRYFVNRIGENPEKEYKRFQVSPDFSKKFVYVPLHYQPERTTSPQGGIFVNQILMIELLASVLPRDWLIYVKEHPTQWLFQGKSFFEYRYKNYYRSIAQIKNVRLISSDINSYALINGAQAVATVSGTAGWEAVWRSRPVLVFGYPWYQACEGVFKVRDAASCRAALERVAAGVKINSQRLINYLVSLDKASFHGCIEELGIGVSELSLKENTHNITEAILRALPVKA